VVESKSRSKGKESARSQRDPLPNLSRRSSPLENFFYAWNEARRMGNDENRGRKGGCAIGLTAAKSQRGPYGSRGARAAVPNNRVHRG